MTKLFYRNNTKDISCCCFCVFRREAKSTTNYFHVSLYYIKYYYYTQLDKKNECCLSSLYLSFYLATYLALCPNLPCIPNDVQMAYFNCFKVTKRNVEVESLMLKLLYIVNVLSPLTSLPPLINLITKIFNPPYMCVFE